MSATTYLCPSTSISKHTNSGPANRSFQRSQDAGGLWLGSALLVSAAAWCVIGGAVSIVLT